MKSHTRWVGLVAVVISLLLLSGFQYIWLGKLEKTSALAQQAALRNSLEAVATKIEYFYRNLAERTLNIPSPALFQRDLVKIAEHWKRKSLEGIRRIFLVDYSRVSTGNFFAYNPRSHTLEPSAASDESLAIVIACLPWQARVYASGVDDVTGLHVNEQDPEQRIVLSPITDELSRIAGVVAMILDEDFFRRKLLRQVAEKTLRAFFSPESSQHLMVTVRDHEQKIVLGEAVESGLVPAAISRFHFVFTDWTLGLYNLGSTPEQWAKKSFIINMTLAFLLALVLLAGIVLTLRAANKAMRLSEMKSDFVSNVSHELRTPLASIRVFAEFLRLGRAESARKVEEYGEYIEVESHRLSRLIDNILDFSRIESGRKAYRFVPTQLGEILSSVMKSHTVRLGQCGFNVTLDTPIHPLALVEADPDAIAQAVHNLLDNAIKYSQQSKNIAVRLYEGSDFLVISVQDQGIGISKEEQKGIFERFHRVGSGLVHDIKGNGLGLSIVRHIVEAHQGQVRVESEPGQGSTFFIRLPLSSHSAEDQQAKPANQRENT